MIQGIIIVVIFIALVKCFIKDKTKNVEKDKFSGLPTPPRPPKGTP